jgi:hypothetical protein
VWEYLFTVLAEPRRVIAEMEALRQAQGVSQAVTDLATVRAHIAALDDQERKLIDLALAADSPLASGIFAEKQREITAQREQWRVEEAALAVRVVQEEQSRVTEKRIADVERWCTIVRQNLATATFEQKRNVLAALNVSIEVDTRGGQRKVAVSGWLPTAEFAISRTSP